MNSFITNLHFKDILFFGILLGFGVGVCVASIFGSGSFIFVYLFTLISMGLFVVLVVMGRIYTGYLGVVVFFVASAFGVWRFYVSDIPAPFFLEQQVGTQVSLSGLVIDDPDRRDSNTKISVRVVSGDESGIVLLSVDPYTEIRYGDEVQFSGKLLKPKNFTTDQGREFDYQAYLWKDDIRYTISYAQVVVISHDNLSRIKSVLFRFKNNLLDKFSKITPYPESGLLGGILLGHKQFLTGDIRDEFIVTGTIHIVALSGYNVSVVAEAIIRFFRFFSGMFVSSVFGLIAIVLFVLMTGAQATAVRAGVMACIALGARLVGRPYAMFRALLFAGFCMTMWNPRILYFDISFQLSFIATLGLIFIAPIVDRWFKWITSDFFREILSATIAAQIAVLPILLYKMGVLSIVSLPVNILILPFVPFAMLFGSIAGFVSFVSHLIAVPFGYVTYGLLNYIFSVVHFGSEVPFASFNIRTFPLWLTLFCYTLIIFWVARYQIQIQKEVGSEIK